MSAVQTDSRTKAKPDARLEDLDVREVSVVDRPATGKRFLIVKRHGDVVVLMEDDMARSAIAARTAHEQGHEKVDKTEEEEQVVTETEEETDDVSILDIFDDSDDEQEETQEEETEEEDEEEEEETAHGLRIVEKSLQSAALAAVSKIIGVLTAAVKQVKQLSEKSEKDMPGPLAAKFKAIAEGLSALVSKLGGEEGKGEKEEDGKGEKEEQKKGIEAAAKTASSALEKLMAVANKIKALDKGADSIPGPIVSELRSIAAALAGLAEAGSGGEAESESKQPDDKGEKEEQKKAAKLEVFAPITKGDNPSIVIKRGAKMKRIRLDQLRKAVTVLTALLKDLEGAEDDDKTPTKKDLGATVTKAFDALTTKLGEQFGKVTEKLDAVDKRVDGLENIRPAGNAEEEETTVEEVKKSNEKSMWADVIGPIAR